MPDRKLKHDEAKSELERRSDFSAEEIKIIIDSSSPDAINDMSRICDNLNLIPDRSYEGLRKYFGLYESQQR
jgi:hypothetical protein